MVFRKIPVVSGGLLAECRGGNQKPDFFLTFFSDTGGEQAGPENSSEDGQGEMALPGLPFWTARLRQAGSPLELAQQKEFF